VRGSASRTFSPRRFECRSARPGFARQDVVVEVRVDRRVTSGTPDFTWPDCTSADVVALREPLPVMRPRDFAPIRNRNRRRDRSTWVVGPPRQQFAQHAAAVLLPRPRCRRARSRTAPSPCYRRGSVPEPVEELDRWRRTGSAARQGQVDLDDFFERQPLVDAAEPLEVVFRQWVSGVLSSTRPTIVREADKRRDEGVGLAIGASAPNSSTHDWNGRYAFTRSACIHSAFVRSRVHRSLRAVVRSRCRGGRPRDPLDGLRASRLLA